VKNLPLTAEVRDFVADDDREDRMFEWTEKSILSCLLAVLLTKLHLRAKQNEFTSKVQCLLGTQQGRDLEQVSSVFKEMAEGTREYQDSQETDLQTLLTVIHGQNRMLLPMIAYPDQAPPPPFMELNPVRSYFHQARDLVDDFHAVFERIPGALKVLRDYVMEFRSV